MVLYHELLGAARECGMSHMPESYMVMNEELRYDREFTSVVLLGFMLTKSGSALVDNDLPLVSGTDEDTDSSTMSKPRT